MDGLFEKIAGSADATINADLFEKLMDEIMIPAKNQYKIQHLFRYVTLIVNCLLYNICESFWKVC